MPRLSAERHAQPDLARAGGHTVALHTVHADRRERRGYEPEHREKENGYRRRALAILFGDKDPAETGLSSPTLILVVRQLYCIAI